MNKSSYRIVTLDIENSPNISYTWGKYQQDVIAFQKQWHLLTAAWKWYDESKIHVYGLPDFKGYSKDRDNDRELTKALWRVFDEADLIIGHNVKDFDIRKANARFIHHGLPPPSPYKIVDTLKVLRARVALNSNKLGDVARDLLGEAKIDTGGIELWLGCLENDPTCWAKMKKYNAHDVRLTEKLYDLIRAWDAYHPNITLASGKSLCCPVCGSLNVQRRGFEYMKSFCAQRFRCNDCGKWSKGKREKLPALVLN